MKQKTITSQLLEDVSLKPYYDSAAKRLLSTKEIAAQILHLFVEEFQDVSLQAIRESAFEMEPQVGEKPVDVTASQVTTVSEESNGLSEGRIFYDVHFVVRNPKNDARSLIVINYEMQNNEKTGYDIASRALYYCARLISDQKDKAYGFSGSNYNDIKKVYSIWFVRTKDKAKQNCAAEYSIQEEAEGAAGCKKASYDLLKALVVYLGDADMLEAGNRIRFVDTLFTPSIPQRVQSVLEAEYDVPMVEDVKGGIEKMCNLSEGIFEDGVQKGRAEGLAEGKHDVIIRAIQNGFNDDQIKLLTNASDEEIREIRTQLQKS